jgi:hypothetical protein
MVEIIRDVNSNAELQSSVTVKIKVDNSPVEAYNIYAETNKLAKLEVLPTSFINYLQLR